VLCNELPISKLSLINLQELCYIWLYSGEFNNAIYSNKLTAQIMLLPQRCILYNIMRIEIMLVSINYDMMGYETVKTGIKRNK